MVNMIFCSQVNPTVGALALLNPVNFFNILGGMFPNRIFLSRLPISTEDRIIVTVDGFISFRHKTFIIVIPAIGVDVYLFPVFSPIGLLIFTIQLLSRITICNNFSFTLGRRFLLVASEGFGIPPPPRLSALNTLTTTRIPFGNMATLTHSSCKIKLCATRYRDLPTRRQIK
jgi:hypothetical protein